MSGYLTTRELAELLRTKERKVYDLAAQGAVPCTRVTGKLLFPEAKVRAWLAAGASGPGIGARPPAVLLGSHDPLLDWAVRESGAGLATLTAGSADGLARFAAAEGVAAGLHLRCGETGRWNVPAVQAACAARDAVLMAFATRERGLVCAPGAGIATLTDLAGRTLARREPASGAEPLLDALLAEAGIDPGLIDPAGPYRSEADAVMAVKRGEADAAFGLACLARPLGLDFAPVLGERFDLLVDRAAWFDPPMLTLMAFLRSEPFRRHAAALGGYEIAPLGRVLWNAGAPQG